MGFLRNPEIRREAAVFAALLVLSAAAGFLFLGAAAGLSLAGAGLVYGALHFISSYWRYRRISELSRDIDLIVHGNDSVDISSYSEGELSILQGEVQKMLVRLREHADELRSDKAFLTDAIADISHQLRTPLTSINLILAMLSDPELSPERRGELNLELRKLAARIDSLVTSLLKISKIDAGTVRFARRRVEFSDLLRLSAEPLAVPMELKEQTLTVECAEGAGFWGDKQWTAEAVGNILKNCMEHTPNGGEICVSAMETPVCSVLVITDSGEGIAEEDLPHVFERFYRGRSSGGGSFGIGLSLARMIIAAQNGTVKASNRQDGGARFTVRFYRGSV